MTSEEQLRAELEAAGAELAKADEARTAAVARLRAAVRAADQLVPKKHMAELAGVARMTVYAMLED